MKVLVTGAAGFIGFYLIQQLLARGDTVIGIDNLNDYYEVSLKQARLDRITDLEGFTFHVMDISDRGKVEALFQENAFDAVVNLAAQAGVRYSLVNPNAYIDSNVVGFANILEGCRHSGVGHLVFSSSSSVYGANTRLPFSEQDNVDHPLSLYAATKKSNEMMAHSYAHLYDLACTGLRFFTVYGPWGRPDMAYYSFTRKILRNESIPVFNNGRMKRDFTYIDDIVSGVLAVIDCKRGSDETWDRENPDPSSSYAPYQILNIGNNKPVELMEFIDVLQECLGKKAIIDMLPMQDGDVEATYANIDAIKSLTGFHPHTDIRQGLSSFVEWYRSYYPDQFK